MPEAPIVSVFTASSSVRSETTTMRGKPSIPPIKGPRRRVSLEGVESDHTRRLDLRVLPERLDDAAETLAVADDPDRAVDQYDPIGADEADRHRGGSRERLARDRRHEGQLAFGVEGRETLVGRGDAVEEPACVRLEAIGLRLVGHRGDVHSR